LYDVRGLQTVVRVGDAFQGDKITRIGFAASAIAAHTFSGLNAYGDVAFSFTLASGPSRIAIWSAYLPGDFNQDNAVNAADFYAWQQFDGSDVRYRRWLQNHSRAVIPGDFNGDGRVDGVDLTKWKADVGHAGSDADGDGDSDGADLLVWQRNLGRINSSAVAAPEPASFMLATVLAATSCLSLGMRRDS
jgi:hypothetical protein